MNDSIATPQPTLAKAGEHRPSADFGRTLPRLARLLRRPVLAFWLLVVTALGLGCISKHLAIGVAAFGCFYWCLRLERRHFDRLAMPPLVLFGFCHLLSSGIGLPLIWLGISFHKIMREGELNAIWLTQLAHAVAFPLLIVGYKLGRAGSPRFSLGTNEAKDRSTSRILSTMGWFLFAYYIITTAAGIATGSGDRSRIPEFLERGYGIWTWFRLFPRLNSLFFLLVPLMFARASNIGRLVLAVATGGALCFNFLSGSRSLLLLPVCLLIIGWWMFRPHSRRIIRHAGILALLAIPYIISVPFYRSTSAFADVRQTDWRARFSAIGDMFTSVRETQLGGTIQLTGESLHGVNDRKIFLGTPETLPHAGWQNIDRLETFWLPNIFAPEKKSLLDGNEIVQIYRPDDFVFGAGISFVADMFRRFGWTGVAVGPLVLGLLLGLIYRWAFHMQHGPYHLYGTLFILYGLTYFNSTPYLTLLETCWIWLWELPKHFLALVFLAAIASLLSRRSRKERSAVYRGKSFSVPQSSSVHFSNL